MKTLLRSRSNVRGHQCGNVKWVHRWGERRDPLIIHHVINNFFLSLSGRRFRLTSQNSSSVHCIYWSRHKTLAMHKPRARHVPRLTPSGRPATRLQSSRARLQVREKATTAWQSDLCTRHWSTETRQSSHCLSASGETGGQLSR